MCNNHSLRKKTALIIAVLFLTITLFSSAYIIIESEHDCIGEDCHICHMIDVCEAILQRIENTFSAFPAVISFYFIFIILHGIRSSISSGRTLFDLKVRLNS